MRISVRGRRGASAMQYATILGLIAVIALAATSQLGGSLKQLITIAGNGMNGAVNITAGAGGTGGGAPSGPPITAGTYTPSGTYFATQAFATSAILAGVSGGTGTKTVTAVASGTNCTASLAGATVNLSATAAGASCSYTVTDSIGVTATGTITPSFSYPASCVALHALDAALPDGNYTVRPGSVDVPVYCDMDLTVNGVTTWTLVISPSIGTTLPTAASTGTRVTPNSHLYMALSNLQEISTNSSTILLQQRGAATPYAISSTSVPATRMRAGQLTNSGTSGSGTTNWVMSPGLSMNWSCTVDTATGYPNVHWSCGNGVGVHLVSTAGNTWWRWDSSLGVTEIDVWVH